jgi:hypothetical protein
MNPAAGLAIPIATPVLAYEGGAHSDPVFDRGEGA